MSTIANWSYQNTATIYPYQGQDTFNGGVLIGTPYTIACTWTGKAETRTDSDGSEFVTRNTFWTEHQGIKRLDKIAKGDTTALNWMQAKAEEIRAVTDYDMSPFGEAASPDFEIVT